jgi:hypothetical protein
MSESNDPSLFALFTEPLNALGIDYMVTGSVAGIVYGEPRLTHDVDLVLSLAGKDVPAFHAAFPIEDFYLWVFNTRLHRNHWALPCVWRLLVRPEINRICRTG